MTDHHPMAFLTCTNTGDHSGGQQETTHESIRVFPPLYRAGTTRPVPAVERTNPELPGYSPPPAEARTDDAAPTATCTEVEVPGRLVDGVFTDAEWTAIRQADTKARAELHKLPRCELCRKPMCLDQTEFHHSCKPQPAPAPDHLRRTHDPRP